MSPAMHKHNVQHPKSKESAVSSRLQPTPPWQAAVHSHQHEVAGQSSLKQHSASRPSPESGRVQCVQTPEILPAMSIPLSEPGHKHDVATAQNLGQALGSRRNTAPRHPIAFGPALEQYVQQVEVALAGQPAVFDEVLQVLHEYQAQDISCDVLQRQIGQLLHHHPQLVKAFQQFLPRDRATSKTNHKQDSKHKSDGTETSQAPGKGRIRRKSSAKYMLVMRNLDKRQYKNLQRRFRHKGVKVNNWEHLMSWLSPAQRGAHTPWWTFIFSAAILVIFFFMAGGYGLYLAKEEGCISESTATPAASQYDTIRLGTAPALAPGPALNNSESGQFVPLYATGYSQTLSQSSGCEDVEEWMQAGPRSMGDWVAWQSGWRQFDFAYLLEWGGQYGPALQQGQWWRWITWVFVHMGFQHVTANLLMWLALALPLEYAYGSPRILAVWLISAFGSSLFAAAFQAECTLVVGCSGAVFGFMGLYVADMLLNFHSLSLPWLRLIWIAATLAYFIVASVTQGSFVSYWAHLGGFVCGLFPSFFFLPNLKDKRWTAASRLAKRMGMLGSPSRSAATSNKTAPASKARQKVQQHARRLSGCLLTRRPSESLLMSYLQMQADGLNMAHESHATPEHTAQKRHATGCAASAPVKDCDGKRKLHKTLEPGTAARRVHQGKQHSRQSSIGGVAGCFTHPSSWFKKSGLRSKGRARNRHVLPAQCPRSQCCGLPVHLVIAFSMGIGLLAVLGVFLALPLYVYLERLPGMQC